MADIPATAGTVHFGNHLKDGTREDIGLDACTGGDAALGRWLSMIAREAMDMGLLPGISHPRIPAPAVERCWRAGTVPPEPGEISSRLDYPFNGLFSHPASGSPAGPRRLARAV